jgi:hypothetical protein
MMNWTIEKNGTPGKFLSILWIFVLMNMIYADILGMLRPGYIELLDQMSRELTPGTVLMFSVLMEIPIIMIPLSWILKRKANRRANFIAVPLSILWVVVPALMPSMGSTPLSYVFFATIEVSCMLLIFRMAWRWPAPSSLMS